MMNYELPSPPSWIVEFRKCYWLTMYEGPRRIIVLNFIKIGGSIAAILQFCKFLKWRPPPSWIFEIVNFYLLTVSGGPRHITVPYFVKIGRSVTDIFVIFRIFKMAAAAMLDF